MAGSVLSGSVCVLAREMVPRKGFEDSRDILAVVSKTASAVVLRLVAKGVVRPRHTGGWNPRVGAQLSAEMLYAAFVACQYPHRSRDG